MKHALALLALMLVAAGLFAISAKVVDADGPATVRFAAGRTEKVAIGKSYNTGDSIRTGKGGMVELSQSGLTIRVGPSTVFTLLEKEVAGKPKGVLAVTLGTREDEIRPAYRLRTPYPERGVHRRRARHGADGLGRHRTAPRGLIVDSGLVSVEAYGKSVELGPDEAVEVHERSAPRRQVRRAARV